jgi:ubiquinone/menaquinone biosynthesis C-methylase UbiE
MFALKIFRPKQPGSGLEMARHNQQVYSAPGIVGYYAHLAALQAPEADLLAQLAPRLDQMAMLDLGVGAGRTTHHFAPLVASYLGIDYSAAMIAACEQRFTGVQTASGQPPQFAVADVRDLEHLPSQGFDLILFSFNGLDFVTHLERLQVLAELYRLCQPGGTVCFSSHNLQGIESQFDWRVQWQLNPLRTYVNLVMAGVWRWFNPGVTLAHLQAAAYQVIRDESHNFQLKTYYVRPSEQVKQLAAAGFEQVQVFTWREGRVVLPPFENCDPWLYYCCQAPS